jgi:hypothetical protein
MSRLVEISIPVEQITVDNLLEECCRIAALLLLAGISDHYIAHSGTCIGKSTLSTAAQVRKLHIVLVGLANYRNWILLKPLMLWSLALGAVSASDEEESNDMLHLMVYTGELLGLHNWMDVLLSVSNLLWVSEVFNEKFSKLVAGKPWKRSD